MKKDEVRESSRDTSQRDREKPEQFVGSEKRVDFTGRARGRSMTAPEEFERADEDDRRRDADEDRLFLDEDEAKIELPR